MNTRKLHEMADSYAKAEIVYTALDLKLFDLLAKKELTINELATRARANKESLQRFCTWLVRLGLLRRKGSKLSNTNFVERYLTRTSKENRIRWILSSRYFKKHLWPQLTQAVKEGMDQWNTPKRDMWEKFYANEESRELKELVEVFAPLARDVGRQLAKKYKFKKGSTIVDVGGGRGDLISQIVTKNSTMNGIVTDLKPTIYTVKGFHKNVQYVVADFRKEDLPHADYMILAWILHDWDEQTIATILQNCHKNLSSDGRLLIAETLPHSKQFDYWDIMDGHMLVATKAKSERCKNT